MLVQSVEGELVYVDAAVHLLEETAGGADILHYEMAYAHDYLVVVCGKHLLHRGLT
jgi:hypothetical protein